MSFFWRLLIGIFVASAGLVFVVKTRKVVHMIGYNNWAEQHIGPGGTYTFVKLLGIGAMIVALMVILNIPPVF